MDGKIGGELVKRYTDMDGKIRCEVPTTYDISCQTKINPLIKYMYYSDAIFHCMLVNKADNVGKIPYDMMLVLNEPEIISELLKISEHKRMYEDMLLNHIYRHPYTDWESDGLFKSIDGLYSSWNGELEKLVDKYLSSHTTKIGDNDE